MITFDLSGLAGQVITGLRLEARRYTQSGTVEYELFDVHTSAADLAQRGVTDAAIHADLGTGSSYGSFAIIPGGSFDIVQMALNAAAVADANAAIGGYFSVGGRLNAGDSLFSTSNNEPGGGGPGYIQQLVVTHIDAPAIPLPAGFVLLAGALGVLGVARFKSA